MADLFSPMLHGLRTIGRRGELTSIYCGTGMGIQTLYWAISGGDGIKEYDSDNFPMS